MSPCTGVHFTEYTEMVVDLWGWKHEECKKRRFCHDCAETKLSVAGFGDFGKYQKELLEMCGACFKKTTDGLCGISSKCDQWIIPVWPDGGFFQCSFCEVRECYACGICVSFDAKFRLDYKEQCERCQIQ
eukprot:UN12371